jgi:uncharacterized oxidoreductase
MKLSGNTILVTGGSVGIGLGLARALAKENRVLICGRRIDRLEAAQEKVPQLEIFPCDIGSSQGRRSLVEWANGIAPDLNVLINNAGIQNQIDLVNGRDASDGHYDEISINLEAPIHLSEMLIKKFRTRERAAIVNITSGLAFTPFAKVPIYCATKAAMHSFSLSLRHQLKDTGIKVFEVAPPLVQSELHDHQESATAAVVAMPTDEFVTACLRGLEQDTYTNAVGLAAKLFATREDSIALLNRDQ